jgi:hypothetical protein
MSILSVNDIPAIGELVLPRVGRWIAKVKLLEEVIEGQQVTLKLEDISWKGTVRHSIERQGIFNVFLEGGKGKLGTVISSRQYVKAPVNLILSDLLRDVGEDVGTLEVGRVFDAYVRCAETAASIVNHLQLLTQFEWRFTNEGKFVAHEPKVGAVREVDLINSANPTIPGGYDLAFTPDLEPTERVGRSGIVFKLDAVSHIVSESDLRTRIYTRGAP